MTKQRDERLGRLGRDALHPADALPCERADLRGHLERCRRDREVLPGLHANEARRLRRPVTSVERRADGDRDLAEDRTGDAPAQGALNPVEQLDDLHLAREDREQRTVPVALVHGVFPGTEVDVGRRLRQQLELGRPERREQRDSPYLVNCQHGRCDISISAQQGRGSRAASR